jgi:hypothetical protein
MYDPRQLQTIAAQYRAEQLRTAERKRLARSAKQVDRDIAVLSSVRRQLRRASTAGVLAVPPRSTPLAKRLAPSGPINSPGPKRLQGADREHAQPSR